MSSWQSSSEETLRTQLQKARENQARWLEMPPAPSAEHEEMEQWATIASLRKQEVERLETLIRRSLERIEDDDKTL